MIAKEPARSEKLLLFCERYFEHNCTRLICYDDLRPYVEQLNDRDQEDVRARFASCAKGMARKADASEVMFDDLH